jgi:hypothetical protein
VVCLVVTFSQLKRNTKTERPRMAVRTKTCFLHSDASCVRLRAFVLLCQVGRSFLLAGKVLSMDTHSYIYKNNTGAA